MNNIGYQLSNNLSIGIWEDPSRNLLRTIDFDALRFEELKTIVRQIYPSSVEKPVQWKRQDIRSFENVKKMRNSGLTRLPLKLEFDWFARENQLINLRNISSQLKNLVNNQNIEILIENVNTLCSNVLEVLSDKREEQSILSSQEFIKFVKENSNEWDFNVCESMKSARKCSAEIEKVKKCIDDGESKKKMIILNQKSKCWSTLIDIQKTMKKIKDVEECWNEMRRNIFEKQFSTEKEKARQLVPNFMKITAIDWEILYQKQKMEKKSTNIELPYKDIHLQGIENAPVAVLKAEVLRLREIKSLLSSSSLPEYSRRNFVQPNNTAPLSLNVEESGTNKFSIESIIGTLSSCNRSMAMPPGFMAPNMTLSGVLPIPFPWFPLQPFLQSFQTSFPLVSINPMDLQSEFRKRNASNESDAYEKMPKLDYMGKCVNYEESDLENEVQKF